MLSVPVQKDFTAYEAKLIGPLTLRTFTCLAAAVAISVAAAFACISVLKVPVDYASPIIWGSAAVAAAVGFFNPHGMKLEKFLPLWLAHEAGNQLVLYKSPAYLEKKGPANEKEEIIDEIREEQIEDGRFARLRREQGYETWDLGPLDDIGR